MSDNNNTPPAPETPLIETESPANAPGEPVPETESSESTVTHNEEKTADPIAETPPTQKPSDPPLDPNKKLFLKPDDTDVHGILRKILGDMKKLIHFTEEEFIKLGNLMKIELEKI